MSSVNCAPAGSACPLPSAARRRRRARRGLVQDADAAGGVAGGRDDPEVEHAVAVADGREGSRDGDPGDVLGTRVAGRAGGALQHGRGAAGMVGVAVGEDDMGDRPTSRGRCEPRAASISSSLPATPVSTIAASPPRARMYAETNPRLTRDQRSAPPAESDGGVDDPAADAPGVAPGDVPGVGDEPPAPLDAEGRAEAIAAGEQAASEMTARANAPLPRSATKVRRSMRRVSSTGGLPRRGSGPVQGPIRPAIAPGSGPRTSRR